MTKNENAIYSLARRLAICLAHEAAYNDGDIPEATRQILSEACNVLELQSEFERTDSLHEGVLNDLLAKN